jgi:cytidine deaminase
MKDSVRKGKFEDVIVAVLDVAKGKLITATKEENTEYSILLEGEAASFMSMWTAMSARANAAAMRASAR